MQIEIQLVRETDIDAMLALLDIFGVVFEMDDIEVPDRDYVGALLAKENFKAVVAFDRGCLVGGLTAHVVDVYYSKGKQAYIWDLAVLGGYQRQGIGTQLMTFALHHFKESGCEEVFVQAEKGDEHALNFYRKTRPTGELDSVHFNYVFGTPKSWQG